ncbi:MAG: PKD domain-containing protein [Deltaproteobacteria bacterium]|nr:PKD domain-containing protein [Deltaproteobacteria bacterium]
MAIGYWFAIGVAVLAGCHRSESPGSGARPSPSPVPTIEVSSRQAAPPAADDAANDNDDDKPMGPEFEIDADANWYLGFPPMTVTFTAKALNGAPPFTYTWHFADGSPDGTGEWIEHTYVELGAYQPFVEGKDANGELSQVSFFVRVVTLEDWARIKEVDPALLRATPSPTP